MLEMMQQKQIGSYRLKIDRVSFFLFRWDFIIARVLLTFGGNGKVILCGKGSGGLNEMKKKLNDNQMYVGVIRVRAVDDHGSQRTKFVYFNYVGVAVVIILLSSIFNKKFWFF